MNATKKKSAPPKLHKFMHPRNPYRMPPSFKSLAVKYPEFRTHCLYELEGKVRLNFKDPNAVRALTTCLLDQDFGLKVSIPDGRLVPTLPLRFNYLLWIEDLLTLSAYHSKERRIISGLDIGCGSACIYPLLASKQFGWFMTATEADDINYNSAVNNVENNKLGDNIIVRKVADDMVFKSVIDDETLINNVNKSILKLFKQNHSSTDPEENDVKESGNSGDMETADINYPFDFTMCNPPFFSSEEEADSMSKSKRNRSEPSSASTGALQETVTKGGEVAFISQMINESVVLKDKVRIFTTMIGTKADVKSAKDVLKTVHPAHTSVVEFCQGRTMRWGIAWTFDSRFHLENVMSKKQMVEAKPLTLMLPRSLMSVYTVRAAWAMINKWLHHLKITVQLFKNTKYFVGAQIKAYKPTWTHQRRKRREQKRKEASQGKNGKETDKADGEAQLINQDRESLKRTTDVKEDEPEAKRPKYLENDDITLARTSSKDISLDTVQQSQDKPEESPGFRKENTDPPQNMDSTEINAIPRDGGSFQQEFPKGLECILKAKLHMKQSGGLISLEAFYLRGSYGKDGLNQLLQYMRNLLTNPS